MAVVRKRGEIVVKPLLSSIGSLLCCSTYQHLLAKPLRLIGSYTICAYSKPVSVLSDVVYKVCTRVGLVRAYPSDEYDGGSGNSGYSALPGGARAEAERRRCDRRPML